MSRYIDADALMEELHERIDASHEWYDKAKDTDIKTKAGQAIVIFSEVSLTVKNIPTADVRENVRGEWIRITQGAIPEQYMCPFCHRTIETYGIEELLKIRYPYCHCGADMRGA